MYDKGEVMSGVLRGTVLAAILFVIMISNIDENVKMCILRSFAYDTRVSKKVICNEGKPQMQEDMRSIYNWAKNNKMEFNAKKFELIIHGSTKKCKCTSIQIIIRRPNHNKNTVKDLGGFSTNDLNRKKESFLYHFWLTRLTRKALVAYFQGGPLTFTKLEACTHELSLLAYGYYEACKLSQATTV